jgi:hypothetical protein
MRVVITGAVLALVLAPVGAWAQATGAGVFAQFPPGDQKIARALFEAQSPSASAPLTLDEIAAKKQGQQGWGDIFKQMKTQGLLTQKNLGQVVNDFERRHHESAGATARRGSAAGNTKGGAASSGGGAGDGGGRR